MCSMVQPFQIKMPIYETFLLKYYRRTEKLILRQRRFIRKELRPRSAYSIKKASRPQKNQLINPGKRLKRAGDIGAQRPSHIHSKTAYRGFESFCPSQKKSRNREIPGLFLYLFGGAGSLITLPQFWDYFSFLSAAFLF